MVTLLVPSYIILRPSKGDLQLFTKMSELRIYGVMVIRTFHS
jgi:hypothetical protein